MGMSSIALINPSSHDASFLTTMAQHQCFKDILPPCLVPSSTSPIEPSRRTPALNTEERHVVNISKTLEWIFPEGSRIGEVFSSKVMQCFPIFKVTIKPCIRCHSKGFCFANCDLKSIHVTLPPRVTENHHEWKLQHRRA